VSFIHTFRYIDDVLSINIHDYVHLIYPDELQIKDATESDKSATYLDILLNIDPSGRLTTSLYDKTKRVFGKYVYLPRITHESSKAYFQWGPV
jgi:hypothetical protein